MMSGKSESFEQRLRRLEEISEQIRGGDIELEKASAMFEEGIALARSLEKELSSVEGRIEKLVKAPSEPGEKPVLELFPELDGPGE
jgi:exodeoxyribonuclease VII small subunit